MSPQTAHNEKSGATAAPLFLFAICQMSERTNDWELSR